MLRTGNVQHGHSKEIVNISVLNITNIRILQTLTTDPSFSKRLHNVYNVYKYNIRRCC